MHQKTSLLIQYQQNSQNTPNKKSSTEHIKKSKEQGNGNKKKSGLKISQNTRQALLLGIANGNTKWAKTNAKEMEGMKRLDVFKFYPPNKECKKAQG